jgi:hypothetical protein
MNQKITDNLKYQLIKANLVNIIKEHDDDPIGCEDYLDECIIGVDKECETGWLQEKYQTCHHGTYVDFVIANWLLVMEDLLFDEYDLDMDLMDKYL